MRTSACDQTCLYIQHPFPAFFWPHSRRVTFYKKWTHFIALYRAYNNNNNSAAAAMMTASNPPYVDVNRDNESCGAGNYQCCCSTADQSDTSSSDPSFYAANRDFGRVTTTDDEDDRFYAVDDVQTKPRYRSSRATVCGEATRDTRQK